MDYIRFRWLCLPRWLRAVAIGTALCLCVLALIFIVGSVVRYLIQTPEIMSNVCIVSGASLMIMSFTSLAYTRIRPSIKKKKRS